MLTQAAEETAGLNAEVRRDWNEVFHREFPRVYNFLRYRLRDDTLAEDLAAETFARAWRSRNQYEADLASFSTWLFTIARNLAVDHYRRERNELDLEAAAHIAAAEQVDAQVQRRQDRQRLADLLEELPPREQEIIALRYGAEMGFREIGQQMGLSAVNVRVILFRTVRRMRAQWEA